MTWQTDQGKSKRSHGLAGFEFADDYGVGYVMAAQGDFLLVKYDEINCPTPEGVRINQPKLISVAQAAAENWKFGPQVLA